MPPAGHSGGSLPPDVPTYIASLCAGMIRLAEAERMDMLAYLLGMVQLEAEALKRRRTARGPDPSPHG